MRNLRDVLVNDFGLDLTDWGVLRYVFAVSESENGLTIIGDGLHLGNPDVWIATIPYLPMLGYMYVDDISIKKLGKKTFQDVAAITIKEVGGRAVKDAVVHAHWSGMTSGVVSGVTK